MDSISIANLGGDFGVVGNVPANSSSNGRTYGIEFLYQQKKREKELKAKSSQIVVKEIRFGPQTDDHDYEFKKKHAEKFLKEGAKLKAFVFFKGRSIIYQEQGQILLLRLAQDLEELGKVEQMPKLEGKRMTMFIAPKKGK